MTDAKLMDADDFEGAFSDAAREIADLQRQADEWRHVAHYFLGDFTDAHGPKECRAEAVRRAVEDGQRADPVVESLSRQLAEANAGAAALARENAELRQRLKVLGLES